jgi:hypothetical protein
MNREMRVAAIFLGVLALGQILLSVIRGYYEVALWEFGVFCPAFASGYLLVLSEVMRGGRE